MNPVALLLADPSPCLRSLVLTRLLGRGSDDPEAGQVAALRETDRLFTSLAETQGADGSWDDTPSALARLGFLGFGPVHPVIRRGVDALFSRQRRDGSWPIPRGTPDDGGPERRRYDMIPLQTALPLIGLSAAGFAEDPRAERGFEWLLGKRLEDGSWPTGLSSGVYGGVAGYRRLPHSRWGCRSNTTAVLIALSLHPVRRAGPEARRAMDHLLARETREQYALGFETARTLGFERIRGFFTRYALFDPALVLELAARIGADAGDDRVRELRNFVLESRGPYGLWEYRPEPHASRWVSYSLLDTLRRLDGAGGGEPWVGMEPRTPFRAYRRPKKRW